MRSRPSLKMKEIQRQRDGQREREREGDRNWAGIDLRVSDGKEMEGLLVRRERGGSVKERKKRVVLTAIFKLEGKILKSL